MMRNEILEYPYQGTITRIIQGRGKAKDTERVLYDGEMDMNMSTDEVGRTMQTANYIISIPLTKDELDNWIIPHKGDVVSILRYGEIISLTVDNAEPSQLGGVSVYCARNSWDNESD